MTTLATDTRNAACAAEVARVDIGSGTALLVVRSGTTPLIQFSLSSPAFSTPVNGVATANGLPLSANAIASGIADNYQVLSRNGAMVWGGTAGTSAADMILSSTSIEVGKPMVIPNWTHTVP